ncbi:MAG: sugar transferase [Fibrobacterales bacterium]|nr:sugar transferase [Fibrobacterales bacterium]
MNTRALERLLNAVSDLLSGALALGLVFWWQFGSGAVEGEADFSVDPTQLLLPWLYLSAFWTVLFTVAGLYRKWSTESRSHHLCVLSLSVGLGTLILAPILFGPQALDAIAAGEPASVADNPFVPLLCGYALLFLAFSACARMAVQHLFRALLRRGIGSDPIVFIGLNEPGLALFRELKRTPELGYRPVGFIGSDGAPREFGGEPVLGGLRDLERLIVEMKLQGIVLTQQGTRDELFSTIRWLGDRILPVYVIPDLYDVVAGNFKGNLVHGANLKELFPQGMPPWQAPIKRALDVAVSVLLIVLSLPVTLLTALCVRLESPGPVFYVQERVGQYGRTFRLVKFRSMRNDAERNGPQWAGENDPRVTRVGKVIRKLRVDEIPQFWNVLKGEMSVVGPRPERPVFVEKLKEQIPFYSRRLAIKPGITGWAQVRHHYDASIEDVKTKLVYDLYYIENMSLLLDFQILVRTVWVVLTGHGAR